MRQRIDELLDLVGLAPAVFGSGRPHELSGGQRSRVQDIALICQALAMWSTAATGRCRRWRLSS
ncbi:MAG: hypothetical protein HYS05_02385 [Acidobacteria bacterium]|nr:hypothetical protein [Acidobacteriota bacterium]